MYYFLRRGHTAVETVTVTAASESVVPKENVPGGQGCACSLCQNQQQSKLL